jgi:hypothetical protein
MNTERVSPRSYFNTTRNIFLFILTHLIDDDRVALPHFPDEDPDEPEPTGDEEHDAIEQEIDEAIMPAFDD